MHNNKDTSWKALATHDLHFHYDGSITPAIVRRAFQGRPDVAAIVETVQARAVLQRPVQDPNEFFVIFSTIQNLFDSKESMLALLAALFDEELRQGVEYIDFRFGCGMLSKRLGCSEEEVLQIYALAWERARQQGLAVSPTLCFSRDEPMERAQFLQDFVLAHRSVIRAVDVAGPEVPPRTKEFAPFFQRLRAAGLRVTMHAGEFAGAESIWQALDNCGAERIGHGYAAATDPVLLKRLARDQIPLEVCLTSNLLTGVCADLKTHPLVTFVEHNVPVVLCTDDQAIFQTTLVDEYEKAAQVLLHHGIDPTPVLESFAANAQRYAF